MSNHSTNRWIAIIAFLLITANIVSLVYLWTSRRQHDRQERKMPPPNGQAFEFLSRELKLDSSQRSRYAKLRDEHQAAARPISDSIRKMKDAFFALLGQENIADSVVVAKSRLIGSLEEQLDLVTFRHFQQVRRICNADQQKQFDNLIQDVLHRMAPRRQGPPPPRHEEGRPGMPPPPGEDGPPPGQ